MGLAALLGIGRPDRMMRTIDEALDAALDALPGTQAVDAVISADGRAALVLLSDARIALVRTRGRRVSGREVAWPMLRQTYDGIVVETGDRRFGDVALVGVTALDIRRLGQAPMAPAIAEMVAMDELADA
ncbi:hypothetical protein [Sphingomonas ginsenosidimutans]|jgi:hypothetical protein|nr:hypothetical protein [Sphingomonas ginsenosidimutans]MEE2916334.1 hypothetical protein [Pseudomonadota bacterium]